MDERYIQALKSPDKERRRAAIVALGKSGDPAALPHLAYAHKHDPEPELRELALKAGRYAKKMTMTEPPPNTSHVIRPLEPPPAANTPAVIRPLEPPPPGTVKRSTESMDAVIFDDSLKPVIPERQRRQAREIIEHAIDARVKHHTALAMQNLLKALSLDPELEQEERVQRLTSGLLIDQAFTAYSAQNEEHALELVKKAYSVRTDVLEEERLIRLARDIFEVSDEDAIPHLKNYLGIEEQEKPKSLPPSVSPFTLGPDEL